MKPDLPPKSCHFATTPRVARFNVPKDWNDGVKKPIEESFPYLRAWQQKAPRHRWAAVHGRGNTGVAAHADAASLFWERWRASRRRPWPTRWVWVSSGPPSLPVERGRRNAIFEDSER